MCPFIVLQTFVEIISLMYFYYSSQLLKVNHQVKILHYYHIISLFFFGEFTTHTSTHLHNHNNGFLQQFGNQNAMFSNKEVVTLIYQNLFDSCRTNWSKG
jgi:hypothetical protein